MLSLIVFITLSKKGENIVEEVKKGTAEFIEEVKEITKSADNFINKHSDPKSWKEHILNLHVVQILIKLTNELVHYITLFLTFILDHLSLDDFKNTLHEIYKKNEVLRKQNEAHIKETLKKYNN